MLAEMDADDWREWPQFAELMPFGAVQEGLYHGTLASLFYNANRGEKSEVLHPEDFFPHLKRLKAERELTPEEEEARAAKKAKQMMWQCKIQAWKERTALPPKSPPPAPKE